MTIRRMAPAAALLSTLILLAADSGKQGISAALFRHHFITEDIPQTRRGTSGYGTPVLADFDKDGDLDFAACSARGETFFWFENRRAEGWLRHEIGTMPVGQLGAIPLDVDSDGWTDIVIGGFWFRNPAGPRGKPFARYSYDARIKSEIHDLASADVDGDGRLDVVALGDKEGLFWYRVPAGALKDSDWPRTTVTLDVLKTNVAIHSGFAPRGVADLDSDGDVDIVLPDRWLENRSRGAEWVKNPLPFGKRGPWGLSSRSWVVDLDGDADNDIVIVDSDQKDSRAAWLESDGKKPPSFTAHLLPKVAPGVRGSFHSLALADFDGDGDLDIMTAEQEDGSIFPEGATPRWYVWENTGGKTKPRFEERVIFDAKLGGHDIILGDIDGDGDPDVASKIWRRWADNANGGRFHADWFENLRKPTR